MSEKKWPKFVETLALLGALFFLLPNVPSNEDPIDLMPAGMFAFLLFGLSRYLRHKCGDGSFYLCIFEMLMFAGVIYAGNVIANILLSS